MSPAQLDKMRSAIRFDLIADLILLGHTISLLSRPEFITHVVHRGTHDLDFFQVMGA
jgi:hypothetical protein